MAGLVVKFDDSPAIFFRQEAWERMWYVVNKVKTEVGWLGRVSRLSPFRFVIEEVFFPPQDVHGTTTEMQDKDIAVFLEQLQQERGDPMIVNELTAWGHSHASMGLSRSSQDVTTWDKFRKGFTDTPTIAMRANHRGEIEAELHIPEFSLTIEGLVPQLPAEPEVRQPWQDELDKLIEQNVRPEWKKNATGVYTYGGGAGKAYGGAGAGLAVREGASDDVRAPWDDEFDYSRYYQEDWPATQPDPRVTRGPIGPLEMPPAHIKNLSWADRTKIASVYGIKHYNALQKPEERVAWMDLTEDIIEAVVQANSAGWAQLTDKQREIEEASLEWMAADAMSMCDEDILTTEGIAFATSVLSKYEPGEKEGDLSVLGHE